MRSHFQSYPRHFHILCADWQDWAEKRWIMLITTQTCEWADFGCDMFIGPKPRFQATTYHTGRKLFIEISMVRFRKWYTHYIQISPSVHSHKPSKFCFLEGHARLSGVAVCPGNTCLSLYTVVWPLFPMPSRLRVKFLLEGHVDYKNFILVLIKQRL